MTRRSRRRIGVGIVSLFLAPIALYASFPILVPVVLTEVLSKNGFKDISIQLGYPSANAFQIQELAFTKEISEAVYESKMSNMTVTYQLTELLKGRVQRIEIERGVVTIRNATTPYDSALPDRNDTMRPPTKLSSPLTLEELLTPFPPLPFEQCRLGRISIHRLQGNGPLQDVFLNGTLDNHDGQLQAHIEIHGPAIPRYQMTLSGTSLGDAMFSLYSPVSMPPTLAQFSSHAKRIADNTHIQGSMTVNISNVITLIELFYPLDQDLLKIAGTLSTSWNSKLPYSARIDTLSRKDIETLDGTFDINATLPQFKSYAKDLAISAKGDFTATHDSVSWTLFKDSHASTNMLLDQVTIPDPALSIVPQNDHHLSITIPRPLKGSIVFNNKSPFVTADGLIQSEYHIPDFPTKLHASLTHVSGHSLDDLTAEGHFLLSGALDQQLEPSIPIKRLEWKFSGALAMKNHTVRVSLRPRSFVTTSLSPVKDFHIPEAHLLFVEPFTVTYDLNLERWNIKPFFLRIKAPQVSWQDKTVQSQDIKIKMNQSKGSLSTWEAKGQVVILGVETAINDITPPKTNWKFVFSAQPQFFRIGLLGQTADTQLSLQGTISQNLISQKGALNLRLAPVILSPIGFNLRESIHPWPYPIDITNGQISGESDVTWILSSNTDSEPLHHIQAKASINIDELSGHYDNFIFEGLSTNMNFVSANPWALSEPALVKLNKLETGVTISKLLMTLDIEAIPDFAIPRVQIRDFSAQMFAGEVVAKTFEFIPSQSKHAFTLQANGLDVGKILKLEQQEGLKGTGLLDGSIPITLTNNGVEVHDGLLAARPPGGMIQYQTEEDTANVLKSTNEQMNIVLQALSNFHYDVLTIGASYDHTGKLLLETKLQGKNPALYHGKPIHFNLNVEENIPALLKSLQVAKDIEGRIEKLIQRSEERLLQGL